MPDVGAGIKSRFSDSLFLVVQDMWPVGFGLLCQNLAFAVFVEEVPDIVGLTPISLASLVVDLLGSTSAFFWRLAMKSRVLSESERPPKSGRRRLARLLDMGEA